MSSDNRENGIRGEEKNPNADIRIESDLISRLSNFWYYHRWHVIIGIVIFAVLLILISQISTGEKNDGTILMGGPYLPTLSEKQSMYLAFAEVVPSDCNGDGEKSVEIIHYEVYSTEQFKAIPGIGKSSTANVENIKGLNNLITVGDYPICIIDEWLYEDLMAAGGVRPLSDFFEELPNAAIDDFAIRFNETDFAKTFSAFDGMPDSTVLCIRTRNVFGADEELYKNAEELFCAIISYSPGH